MAQDAAAQRAVKYGKELEGRVKSAAEMTPQELRAFEQSLAGSEKLVSADLKLLESIDPALMEASQQALSLLRGQDASSIAPIRNQRKQQRSELVRTLRQQLGPGAETSSAGIKALNQFDLETSSLMSTTQQGALNTLLGSAQAQRAQTGVGLGALQSAGQQFGNVASRVAGSTLAAGQATLGALSGAVQTAGAPFAAAAARGQQMSALGGQVMGIGGNLLGRGLFGNGNSGDTPFPNDTSIF
jgi:hypothetical protein